MKVLKRSELSTSKYECSLCKVHFKSFGKMQDHMLKDHLLNVKNPQISLPWFEQNTSSDTWKFAFFYESSQINSIFWFILKIALADLQNDTIVFTGVTNFYLSWKCRSFRNAEWFLLLWLVEFGFIVAWFALMFFASSCEVLALVRFITEPVMPFPKLFMELSSDCALTIYAVVPIMKDDNIKTHRIDFHRLTLIFLLM